MTSDPKPRLVYRRDEAAVAMGIGQRTLDRLIATRQLKAVRLGGRAVGVSAAELARFIEGGGVREGGR